MRWICVTSDASKHIVPVQKHLFRKYLGFEPEYISTGDAPLSNWCREVNRRLPADGEFVFGLDDYLPTAHANFDVLPIPHPHFDRIGLSHANASQRDIIVGDMLHKYADNSTYQVSCQFSVWTKRALSFVLQRVDGSPWDFEIYGRCNAYALARVEKWYIEESALSRRWPGKINVNGLPEEDVVELISLGLLDESKLINRAVLIG